MNDQPELAKTEPALSPRTRTDRGAKPIFVVGAAGSGTTLLRLILDSHPNIAIGPETAFMRLVKAHRWVPFREHGDLWWKRLGLSEQELERELQTFYGGLFEQAARRQGKKRWGDKTPLHVWHIDEIAKVFDDAVFVCIIRHPAASIASTVTRFRFSLKLAIRTWLDMNRVLIHDGAELDGRLVLARYEDLVADPEGVLREILEWLEEPWSPTVLQHHRVQKEKGAPEVSDGRTRPGDAIDRARASKWMTVFTERERAFVRTRTAAWAGFFGYDIDRPDPVEPFVPKGGPRRYLLTADELAARRRAFADRLDLERPEPPVRERLFRELPPYYTKPQARTKPQQASTKDRLPPQVRQAAGRIRRRLRKLALHRKEAHASPLDPASPGR